MLFVCFSLRNVLLRILLITSETTGSIQIPSFCKSLTAYHLVSIVELQHHIGGMLRNVLRLSVNLHIIEDQSLVPGWIQSCFELFCCLTEMQEGHVCIWIYDIKKKKREVSLQWCSFLTKV